MNMKKKNYILLEQIKNLKETIERQNNLINNYEIELKNKDNIIKKEKDNYAEKENENKNLYLKLNSIENEKRALNINMSEKRK